MDTSISRKIEISKFKIPPVDIDIEEHDGVEIESYFGGSKAMSNLLMNSLTHGFQKLGTIGIGNLDYLQNPTD